MAFRVYLNVIWFLVTPHSLTVIDVYALRGKFPSQQQRNIVARKRCQHRRRISYRRNLVSGPSRTQNKINSYDPGMKFAILLKILVNCCQFSFGILVVVCNDYSKCKQHKLFTSINQITR